MHNRLQMLINETVIKEFQKNEIKNLIDEEVQRLLIEKNKKSSKNNKNSKSGTNKTRTTKEIEVQKFYRDEMTNGAELARKICPKHWADSTKRSYVSKILGKNKNPRKATRRDIEKGHNAIN